MHFIRVSCVQSIALVQAAFFSHRNYQLLLFSKSYKYKTAMSDLIYAIIVQILMYQELNNDESWQFGRRI